METSAPEKLTPADTLYILEPKGPADAHVRKIINQDESEGYLIEDGICSCRGSHYRGDCKHIGMMTGAPPTEPKSAEEAYAIARKWIGLLKNRGSEMKIVGDIAQRRDPVHVVHFINVVDSNTTSESGQEYYHKPFRMVLWEDGLAVIIDRAIKSQLEAEEIQPTDFKVFE